MAYNVSVYGAPDYGRYEERGDENRSMPLAMPAGSPVPPLMSTRRPYTRTKPSMPEVESAAVAKRLFQPKSNALGRYKLAYEIGFRLGKQAAYPLQENTPIPPPNQLPMHAPQAQSIKAPRVVWPQTGNISLKKPTKQPAKPKPAGKVYK